MQRLRAAENRCHGLNGGADNIVFRLLRSQRGARGLGMKAHHPGTRIPGFEMLSHDAGPHAPCGAKLRDFFQKIAVRVEEERNAGRELIHIKTSVDGGLHIRDAIAQGESNFLHRGRSRLTHVVAGDGNRVPLGNVFVGPCEQVGDDSHGLLRRVDVSSARDEFFEDVVLHRAGKFADVRALAASDSDIEREQDRRRGIDRHRGRNLRQFDAIEQALHVFDGVDGDADFADFSDGEGVVGIEADLRR